MADTKKPNERAAAIMPMALPFYIKEIDILRKEDPKGFINNKGPMIEAAKKAFYIASLLYDLEIDKV